MKMNRRRKGKQINTRVSEAKNPPTVNRKYTNTILKIETKDISPEVVGWPQNRRKKYINNNVRQPLTSFH